MILRYIPSFGRKAVQNYPKKVLSRNATIDERAKEAVNKPRDFMDEDDVEMVRLLEWTILIS